MTLYDHNDGTRFLIGTDPATGRSQYYGGERGLVTIAPPGSGKSQCHMEPALLSWPGAAIVLDVTGDLWKYTSKARNRFGPVYKIDVEDPDRSDHYNPFSFIRTGYDHIWEDALSLGSLLYSRKSGGGDESGSGSFFREAGPQYLAANATFIARHEHPSRRNCETLLTYVSGQSMEAFIAQAAKSDIVGMHSTATLLQNADKDTRGNVMWSVKNCLIPWEIPSIAAISRVSDWHPATIRQHNGTVYLCISLERIKDSPALVRVILGQHLEQFMRIGTDKTKWVQLFIDEAPQLRFMSELVTAIEAGRNSRVRCWLAMQTRGQLVATYGKETAESIITMCGLRAYMKPSMEDGGAQHLSNLIGVEDNRMRGTQRPKILPQTIISDYADAVLAFDGDVFRPLGKRYAYKDAEFKKMRGALD